MSSGEEDGNENESQSLGQEIKKRRIQRACDICRRKKIRCDGGQMPQNRCSNCIAYNLECTYVEAAKKRGPPKGYVENLENRLESMEKLLKALCPDADFTNELGSRIDRDNWQNEKEKRAISFDPASATGKARQENPAAQRRPSTANAWPPGPSSAAADVNPDDLFPSDDELASATLTEGLKRLAVEPLDRRFHGKSSGVMLVQAAMNLKRESSGVGMSKELILPPSRRPEFWSPHPWEVVAEEHEVLYQYPPDDLVPQLVENYFTYLNPFLPVLHRPSFERALNDLRHHNDIGFGSVVMLVCALGARWSEDPRIYMEGMSKHSSGWKWFDQVQIHRKLFLGPPRLYDLQIYALSSVFLQSSSSPQSSWSMVGIGIRLAQDVGAHRKKVYNTPHSVETELWKRAFWVLVALDRFSSAALGRPCAIQDEDFDLDLPLEVDDEYWEHPDPAKQFKQPSDVAPYVAYFNSFLRLNQILAFALRTIYSLNKSKILLGFVGPQWEQHIVSELDSELNKWIGTVPDHLRWDERRENFLHFTQSATLHITYYHIQILIHRPFIPSPRKPSPLTFPSFAICTNAARSCSRIADIQRRRGSKPLPQIQIAVFTAAVVLLLNIWGARKAGSFADPQKHMEHVHKCMQVLHCIEERWQSAGRLWDILNELASVGDIPLPDISSNSYNKNKRERGADSPLSNNSSPSQQSMMMMGDSSQRPIAGRKSLGATPLNMQQQTMATPSPGAALPSGLPYGTDQLGLSPDMVPNGMAMNYYGGAQTSSSAPAPGPSSAPLGSQSAAAAGVYGGGAMPNINIFDMYHPDQQMGAYVPMMQQGYPQQQAMPPPQQQQSQQQHASQGMSQQQKGVPGSAGQYSSPVSEPVSGGSMQEGYMPMEGQMAPMNEALQMWSSAPTSFDMEDWGSYLHTMNGTAGQRQPPNHPS